MSKAFTRENAATDDALDPPDDEPRQGTGPRYITAEGARRLQDELKRLWKVERPRITAEVSAAAAQGDRSENAEYIYGKKKLREIDRRVRFLSKRLEAVTVVEPRREADRVFFGAWVTVEDEEGAAATYRIVGPDELGLSPGCISVEAPLARALLGRRVGDEVTVVRPKGTVELVVLEIRYAPSE